MSILPDHLVSAFILAAFLAPVAVLVLAVLHGMGRFLDDVGEQGRWQ